MSDARPKTLRDIREAMARAAEDFARDMRIQLPTPHDAECPPFCGGPEQHALGGYARTMLDVSRMQQALADGLCQCAARIGTEQLEKMTAALTSRGREPSR